MKIFLYFSVYLNVYWHGFRFLRGLILLNCRDVLVYLRVINTSQAIRLTFLATLVASTVSTLHKTCNRGLIKNKNGWSASRRSTSAELNRSLWSPAFPDLRSRLRDLFLFLLRKENNLQILAFLINNCLHLEDSIWLSKRSMFFGGVARVPWTTEPHILDAAAILNALGHFRRQYKWSFWTP